MDIEQRIRREVGRYFIRRTKKVYSQYPEIRERLAVAAATVTRQRLDDGLAAGKISPEKANQMWEEYFPDQVGDQAIEKMCIELGIEWQCGRVFYADAYLTRLGYLDFRGIKNPVLGITCSKALGYLQRNESIIERLKKKQTEENLKAAVSTEAIRSAIKKEYPTAEEYITISKERMENNILLEKLLNGITLTVFNKEMMDCYLEYFVAEDVKRIWKQT